MGSSLDIRYLYTFVHGEWLEKRVEVLPDRWVRVLPDGEPTPVEDYGDYVFSRERITPDEVHRFWMYAQEAGD